MKRQIPGHVFFVQGQGGTGTGCVRNSRYRVLNLTFMFIPSHADLPTPCMLFFPARPDAWYVCYVAPPKQWMDLWCLAEAFGHKVHEFPTILNDKLFRHVSLRMLRPRASTFFEGGFRSFNFVSGCALGLISTFLTLLLSRMTSLRESWPYIRGSRLYG